MPKLTQEIYIKYIHEILKFTKMLYTLYTKSYIHKVCRDSGTKCDRGMKLRVKARDSKCIMAASNKAAVT